MFSALKHQGKRLYELARRGIEVPRKAREVNIFRLELLSWQPPSFSIEVECSGGTYIRSLAHDIGSRLGCGACLTALTRTRCGCFHIDQAIPLPALEEAFQQGYWRDLLHPIDTVLSNLRAVIVDEHHERAIVHGRSVSLELSDQPGESREDWGNQCRAYSLDGRFLAVLRWKEEEALWHPAKVFAAATPSSCHKSSDCSSGCCCQAL